MSEEKITLTKGQSALYARTVTEADIVLFAGVTGDTNPLHMDEEAAQKGFFKGRVAHGMLTAGFISAALGTRLPGAGGIYLAQKIQFIAPVRIGDTVTIRITITDIDHDKKRVTCETKAFIKNMTKEVAAGEAVVFVPHLA